MENLSMDSFNPKKTELIELAEKVTAFLHIEIVDKKTYEQVHNAQMELRNNRVEIEKQGKALRENAIKFQKDVLAVEKELIAIISTVED